MGGMSDTGCARQYDIDQMSSIDSTEYAGKAKPEEAAHQAARGCEMCTCVPPAVANTREAEHIAVTPDDTACVKRVNLCCTSEAGWKITNINKQLRCEKVHDKLVLRIQSRASIRC